MIREKVSTKEAVRTLGDRIRELMLEKQINQSKLAERSGLSQSMISKILSGVRGRKLSRSTILAIADALDANPEWLIGKVSEESVAEGEEKRTSEFARHLAIAIFANLLAGLVSTAAFFLIVKFCDKTISEETTSKLIASVGAIVFWCISYRLAVLLERKGRPFRKNLKYFGYYFPPTTLFVWALDQRTIRLKAEENLRRLEKIVNSLTYVRTIAGIVNPKKQSKTLGKIIDEMDDMEDHYLAQIVTNIRCYADDILGSVGVDGNYDLFRQVMEKISVSELDARPETYRYFLWLLSDVFGMPPKGCFTRKVQKDMIGPLKHAIWRVDRPHLNRVVTIIEQIMADEEDEHDLARQILDMLLDLDWKEKHEVCQIIFDESKKRAFSFPQRFGFDFLSALRQLEHKVFWLDIQSLRDILEEAIKNGDRGLINLKRKAYDELCSKVFAPLEDEKHPEIQNCRVFDRLKEKNGCAKFECTLPDGTKCACEAESLGFRGLYSKKCNLEVGAKVKAKVITIVEVGQTKPKQEFALSASVAKLHPDEARKQSNGRGIFFEDGEDDVVKGLYEYISEHRK